MERKVNDIQSHLKDKLIIARSRYPLCEDEKRLRNKERDRDEEDRRSRYRCNS